MFAQHMCCSVGFPVQTGVQWELVGTSSKPMLLDKIAFCPQTFKNTEEVLIPIMWNPIEERDMALRRQWYPTFSRPSMAEAMIRYSLVFNHGSPKAVIPMIRQRKVISSRLERG